MGAIGIEVYGFLGTPDEELIKRVNTLLNLTYKDDPYFSRPFDFTVDRIVYVTEEVDEYHTLHPGYVLVWID